MLDPWVRSRLRCPECHGGGLGRAGDPVACPHCGTRFPLHGPAPVLLRRDNPLFPRESYRDARPRAQGRPRFRLDRLLPSPSLAVHEDRNLEAFALAVGSTAAPQVLVVGAGRQRHGVEARLARRHLALTFCDVDVGADVDLFCDVHELPFVDTSFDGVIATAVLEHVLYPERAVAELHRVLHDGGIIYTEVPFLQQVHEGAYDFTRYTLSGHRRLLNGFEELSSGLMAGPGTALAWTIEHFALSFSRGRLSSAGLRIAARLGFFWVKYFDLWLRDSPQAMDAASATYFLGRKRADGTTPDQDIVARYVGGGRTRHV
jgi:SAM-dependent methyltransferase